MQTGKTMLQTQDIIRINPAIRVHGQLAPPPGLDEIHTSAAEFAVMYR
jgi:hypothetical protein